MADGKNGKIGIAQALALMDITVHENKPVYFSIEFCKMDGSIGRIERAWKNVKMPEVGGSKSETTGFKYNLKEKNVVLIRNADTKETRAIKIFFIIKFNGFLVFH